MANWSTGDRVWAYYEDDGYWYPATITAIDGDSYTVAWDDEGELTATADYLDAWGVEVDEAGAECYWEEDDAFYAVTILGTNDESVHVQWEDETDTWVDMSDLRFAGE